MDCSSRRAGQVPELTWGHAVIAAVCLLWTATTYYFARQAQKRLNEAMRLNKEAIDLNADSKDLLNRVENLNEP